MIKTINLARLRDSTVLVGFCLIDFSFTTLVLGVVGSVILINHLAMATNRIGVPIIVKTYAIVLSNTDIIICNMFLK